MKIAMIGLGRMGGNMTTRLLRAGHEVVAYDINPIAREEAAAEGATVVETLEELSDRLAPPRVAWVMVPAGPITQATVQRVVQCFEPGDIIVDGGNSNFADSAHRAEVLAEDGIEFIDAGVSGGVWGLENGYCLMVGGTKDAVRVVQPVFDALAPVNGFAHVGPSGAGHFVKMVHNGIEYGMMQAYAEGFDLMHAATEFDLDLHQISAVWKEGSVVRSWLLDLIELALARDASLSNVAGWVDDSGEGRWTVEEAVNRAVPLPAITASLFARFASRDEGSYAAKLTAALRNEFGGHVVYTVADSGVAAPGAAAE